MRIDHDRLFKELLSVFFLEFIELFFPEVYADLDPASLEFLDKEVFTDVTDGEKHAADLVVKARWRGADWFFLFHVEPQSYAKEPFDRRMFQYFARLYEKFKVPVYPIAIFTYDKPKRLEPDVHRVAFPDFMVLEFRFRVIQLNRLNWRDFLRQQNPLAAALMAKMNMTPAERKRVKYECLRLLATLKLNPAKMQLISGFVGTYLRLNKTEEQWVMNEINKLDPAIKKISNLFHTNWQEEGRKEGRKEGAQETALHIASLLLQSKFGKLDPSLKQHLQAMSVRQLTALSKAVLRLQDKAALNDWLARHAPLQADK